MTTDVGNLTFPAESVLTVFSLVCLKTVAMRETVDHVKQQGRRKCQLCYQQTWSPIVFSYSISIDL